jgi:tRNA(His) guanylyltransferase
MANSKYEYVKQFELDDRLLPHTWLVVRVDGNSFSRLTTEHAFAKPNDVRALNLMNRAAQAVIDASNDGVVCAFGESDEFSFVIPPRANPLRRRAAKLATQFVSLFTSAYVFYWPAFMGAETPLQYPPSFDARVVQYPSVEVLRDYLAWRQADCHINNLYNTAFWALVLRGARTPQQAEVELKGTVAAQKNELLFSQFNINYNNEPAMFRKGSFLVREEYDEPAIDTRSNTPTTRRRRRVVVLHVDIIGDQFWNEHPELLSNEPIAKARAEQRDATNASDSVAISSQQ